MKNLIILQILLLSCIAAASSDPGLVGWWQFDEGIGTVAYDSVGSRTGVLYGATWDTGHSGGALRFDGVNDYAGLPINNPIWLPQNDFTVSSWAYFDNEPTCSKVEFVMGCDFTYWGAQYLSMGYCLHRNWCDGKAVFQMQTSPVGTLEKLYSNVILSKNKWFHIVGVRRGTTQEIYVDGNLEGSRTCSSAPINFTSSCNDYKINIGRTSDGCGSPNYYIAGMIDDIQIYNRALSADEIKRLYEGAEPNLIGLEIVGPTEVPELSSAEYKAIAQFDNGTTKDVTALANWQAEPNNIALIDAGKLTTGEALYPQQKINIYAQYDTNEINVNAQKEVLVIAVCPQGNALLFDGSNDFVQVPDGTNNQITSNQISITAWIKLNKDVGGTQRRIICKQQSTTRAWGLEILGNGYFATGNQISFHIHNPNGTTLCTSETHLNINRWYHVALTDNNGEISIYIDGKQDKNLSGAYAIPTQIAAPIIMGKTNPESTFYFDGMIDELAVFGRALSSDEIHGLMFIKLTGNEPNLIGCWNFDEGTGQTAADISGNGNNGSLGNSAGIDSADPCWIEATEPIPCTTEQVMLRDMLGAVDNKRIANQLINDAKAKERASIQLITELQKDMNLKNKLDAIKAKAQINVALTQEEIALKQIETTIGRLENALFLLDYEIDSNDNPPVPFISIGIEKK